MRQKKENLLEYTLKKEMLRKSLGVIFPEIIQKVKKLIKSHPYLSSMLT